MLFAFACRSFNEQNSSAPKGGAGGLPSTRLGAAYCNQNDKFNKKGQTPINSFFFSFATQLAYEPSDKVKIDFSTRRQVKKFQVTKNWTDRLLCVERLTVSFSEKKSPTTRYRRRTARLLVSVPRHFFVSPRRASVKTPNKVTSVPTFLSFFFISNY